MIEAKNYLIHLLFQLREILDHLEVEEYRKVYFPFTASIGSHLRHIIEHILIFISSLKNGNHIEYDNRSRNQPMEYDLELAKESLTQIINELNNIEWQNKDIILNVVINPEKAPIQIESNILREFHFLINHTVHHNAIILSILKQLDKTVPSFFGFAPATIQYIHSKDNSCAP
ncbi:MAG: hypothetical protein KatS3mg129_2845 [Leptospiraceae bacterium]|nr:MAG: hypothetical protein KatS3mg129_2845 [Leptospiraceae bacterium]